MGGIGAGAAPKGKHWNLKNVGTLEMQLNSPVAVKNVFTN